MEDNATSSPPTLKLETVTYHRVDYGDLEAMIKAVYGHECSVPASFESGNDTDIIVYTTGEYNQLNSFDEEDLEEFKSNGDQGKWGLAGTLIKDLIRQKLIPEGDYLIVISW